MKPNKQGKLTLNAGTGMVGGIFIAALMALLISAITGDHSIWSWAIPAGIAVGLGVGAGHDHRTQE